MNTRSEQLDRRAFLKKTAQTAALALGATSLAGAQVTETNDSASKAAGKPQPPLIQIGIFLGTFRRETLEARLDAVKSCGLDCIQMSLDCAGLTDMPDEITPEVAGRIHRAATERGITIASVQGNFNMCHPDAGQRRIGLRRLRVLAEACSQMGTPKSTSAPAPAAPAAFGGAIRTTTHRRPGATCPLACARPATSPGRRAWSWPSSPKSTTS